MISYEEVCTYCIHNCEGQISGSYEWVGYPTGGGYGFNFSCPHVEDHRGWSYYYGQSGNYEGVWTS